MSDEMVTQAQLAQLLGVTPRTVRNLDQEGIPHEGDGRSKRYPAGRAIRWFLAREKDRIRREAPQVDVKELKARKLGAETRLAELEAAKEEGILIPLDIHEERFGLQLDRIRARILNVPGAWAPALVGCRSIPEAMTRLKGLSRDLLQELSGLADETLADLEPED